MTSEQLVNLILEFDKELAWSTGMTYQGHTLKRQEGGWLLICRATHSGKALVAFVGGHSVEACWLSLHSSINSIRPHIVWKIDRYA